MIRAGLGVFLSGQESVQRVGITPDAEIRIGAIFPPARKFDNKKENRSWMP